MTASEFDAVVARALRELPEPFAEKLSEIPIVIQDEPTREELRAAGVRRGTLYGLFQGVPLPERRLDDLPRPPDRILLYRGPLIRDFPDAAALEAEIRTTVLHELGHFFGLSEQRIRKLGYG
jgi:predicted Zn-dependent protease with MMP-like domain